MGEKTGNTPLVEIDGILAKQEYTNPSGSIKDRIAKHILIESKRLGLLEEGQDITEATSGNTGIGLAYLGPILGHKVHIVMPSDMTPERKEIITRHGAELILCSPGDFAEAARISDEIAKERRYFSTNQFSNPLNVECHYRYTGKEILDELDDKVDYFVAGVGTGGTLIGVGKRLKERFPNIKVIAVEPEESAVMSGRPAGIHRISGIGDGFIPEIVKGDNKRFPGLHELIDGIGLVHSDEAEESAKYLSKKGYCVGVSSGANFAVSRRYAEGGARVVTVFADSSDRYLSRGLNKNHNCEFRSLCLRT